MTLDYARDEYSEYVLQAYWTCSKTESYQVISRIEHPLMIIFLFVFNGDNKDLDRWCVLERLLGPLLNVVPQVLIQKTTDDTASPLAWKDDISSIRV